MRSKTIALKGVRGAIGRKMQESLRAHAQLTYTATVDATALVSARQLLRNKGSNAGIEDLLIQAVAHVLIEHPEHNGWVEDGIAHLASSVHMGVAVATSGALMVPVVRDVNNSTLEQIANARRALVAKARAGSLGVKDMTGGTFTLSNLGQSRVEHFTPIINTPQIAILGVGCIVQRPYLQSGGGLGTRPELGLSLTVDHSVVDGSPSSGLITHLVESLESLVID